MPCGDMAGKLSAARADVLAEHIAQIEQVVKIGQPPLCTQSVGDGGNGTCEKVHRPDIALPLEKAVQAAVLCRLSGFLAVSGQEKSIASMLLERVKRLSVAARFE